MSTTATLSETAVILLKAVAELSALSSNTLLLEIVRGRKFGTLSEPYEGHAQWGVLSGKSLDDVQRALDWLVFRGLLKRRAGYSSRVLITEAGLKYLSKGVVMPTAPKTFNQVRTELVEAGVRRLYESYVGREILINSAYVSSDNDSGFQRFAPPLRARILPATAQPDLDRWPDSDHLDPFWPVEVLDSFGLLKSGEAVYEVDGLGWERGKGFEKSTSAWSLVPTTRKQVRCRLNGARTVSFTDGKLYDVVNSEGHGNVLVVRDDRGIERAIIADRPCPHLNYYWQDEHWPYYEHQKPVGVFESVVS
jgi:hypothetical protein